MKKQPLLLSILMTAFNREKYINSAIESVLKSSFSEFEFIIIDDGSTDNTKKIILEYVEKDSRISFYENNKNKGDYPNRNYAASLANGTYIMYVDSDDEILVDGFENCLNAMQMFPSSFFGLQHHENKPSSPFYMDATQVIKNHFFVKPTLMIGPGGMIIKRQAFWELGGFPEIYGPANDLYFNLKAASNYGVLFLPFDFNFYRIHEFQERNNTYSYIYNNYNYLLQAVKTLNLHISFYEKKWILKKAKRRFISNFFKYFIFSLSLKKSYNLIRYTKFTICDFFEGLFHLD